MQKRFGLSEQTYHLPNATRIRYKHAKIPVAKEHNEKFGTIENKISNLSASSQEIMLWALKIHIGLLFKNSSLKFDMKNNSKTFWDIKDFGEEVSMFRLLYDVWANNGQFNPDPFGTVYVADAITPHSQGAFDFIHEITSGTIFFQLEDKIIFVSPWDQGDGMRLNFKDNLSRFHRPHVLSLQVDEQQEAAITGQRVWACETSYLLLLRRRAFSFIKADNKLTLIPSAFPASPRAPSENELRRFCRSFGLELLNYGYDKGQGNAYKAWQP
jgi:hypothetical protein